MAPQQTGVPSASPVLTTWAQPRLRFRGDCQQLLRFPVVPELCDHVSVFACSIFSMLFPQFRLTLFVSSPSRSSSISELSNTCQQRAMFLLTFFWMKSISIDQTCLWLFWKSKHAYNLRLAQCLDM